jgi:AcrR family transcriptional regulator
MRKNLTRTVVMSAAADLADIDGYETISVSALARRLDVQPASLYSHVRDRAEVLDGVQELALGELADHIGTAIAGRSGREALRALAGAHRTYARAKPGRWAAIQRPPVGATVHSDSAIRLVTLISAVLRAYPISEDEMVHATRFMGATINGFVNLERAEAFSQRQIQIELSWQRTIDVLHNALGSWAVTSWSNDTIVEAL